MYKTQVHRSTKTSPYSLVLSRQPPGLSLLTASRNMPDGSLDAMLRRAIRAKIQMRISTLSLKKVRASANRRKNIKLTMTDAYEIVLYSSLSTVSSTTILCYNQLPAGMLKQ